MLVCRKYCLWPAEIASFMLLALLKDEGCRVSPRFHLFFLLMIIKETERWARFKIFLRGIHNCRLIFGDNFLTII